MFEPIEYVVSAPWDATKAFPVAAVSRASRQAERAIADIFDITNSLRGRFTSLLSYIP
jgi:hypothetical protein